MGQGDPDGQHQGGMTPRYSVIPVTRSDCLVLAGERLPNASDVPARREAQPKLTKGRRDRRARRAGWAAASAFTLRTRRLLGMGQQWAGACLKDYTPSLSLAPETLYVDARSS